MTVVSQLGITTVQCLDLMDYLHWLDAAVAEGLSCPSFLTRVALAPFALLVSTPLGSVNESILMCSNLLCCFMLLLATFATFDPYQACV